MSMNRDEESSLPGITSEPSVSRHAGLGPVPSCAHLTNSLNFMCGPSAPVLNGPYPTWSRTLRRAFKLPGAGDGPSLRPSQPGASDRGQAGHLGEKNMVSTRSYHTKHRFAPVRP